MSSNITFLMSSNKICDRQQKLLGIFYLSEDCEMLQKDLDKLLQWEDKWQMSFHPQKCKMLNVAHTSRPVCHTYHISWETELKNVSHAAYLGAEIDEKRTWTKHINQTIAKASCTLNFICQNLCVAFQNIKEISYETLVRSSLNYACTVWDPYTQIQIDQVEIVQSWAARFVTKRYCSTSSVRDMLADLKWETRQERRSKFRVLMIAIPITLYLQLVQGATRHHHNQSFLQQSASTTYLPNSSTGQPLHGTVCLLVLFKAYLARYALPVPM